jgi:hypothetical protein
VYSININKRETKHVSDWYEQRTHTHTRKQQQDQLKTQKQPKIHTSKMSYESSNTKVKRTPCNHTDVICHMITHRFCTHIRIPLQVWSLPQALQALPLWWCLHVTDWVMGDLRAYVDANGCAAFGSADMCTYRHAYIHTYILSSLSLASFVFDW